MTDTGDDRQEISCRVKKFSRMMRLGGRRRFEFAYSVEPNSRRTGSHLHGWLHGDLIDASLLQDSAMRAGMGEQVWIDDWVTPDERDPMITYGMKSVMPILPEGPMREEAGKFLTLNGGKVVAATRGFWRDGRTGEPITRVREAIAAAREASLEKTDRTGQAGAAR